MSVLLLILPGVVLLAVYLIAGANRRYTRYVKSLTPEEKKAYAEEETKDLSLW